MIRAALLALLMCVTAGCAARPASRTTSRQSWAETAARAEGLLRDGCYRCLEEARSEFERGLSAGSTRQLARDGMTRTEVLLAARVRELGLVDTPDWEANVRLAAERTHPGSMERLYVSLFPHVGRAIASAPAEVYERERMLAVSTQAAVLDAARRQLAPRADRDVVAAYFLVVLACTYGKEAPVQIEALPAPTRATPLVAYRIGACGREYEPSLDVAAVAVPRFADAEYFRGEYALAGGRRVLTAERAFKAAAEAFPGAMPPLMGQAHVAMALEEYDAARAAYERVLARLPDQREALLGRTRALTYLGDSAAAEAAADRLLQLGTWYIGEAYFWRAWNRRRLGRLPEAARDAEEAARTLFNAAVPKLSGLIALERGELDRALGELTASRERNAGDCDVHAALGQVQARRAEWSAAGDDFVTAAGCALEAQAEAGRRLAEVEAAQLDAARRDRLRARAERDRAAAFDQEGMASFNAASSFILAGRTAEARRWAERAAAWPAWAARARQLLSGL